MEEQNVKSFDGVMLKISLIDWDVDCKNIKPDFTPKQDFWCKFLISDNAGFGLYIGMMKDTISEEDYKNKNEDAVVTKLIEANLAKKTKDEDGNEFVLLFFDKFLAGVFDWHELIQTDANIDNVAYTYVMHSSCEDLNMYMKVNKGILYNNFIDSMYSSFIDNYETIKDFSKLKDSMGDIAEALTESAEVTEEEPVEEEIPKVEGEIVSEGTTFPEDEVKDDED